VLIRDTRLKSFLTFFGGCLARSSIADLVNDFAGRGEQTAFLFQRGYRTVRWSYAETARVARQFCVYLQLRGARRGDRVILLGPNSAEWVASFLGCALLGAVAVPLDRGSTPDFVQRIIHQVAPVLAVCAPEFAKYFGTVPVIALDELPSLVAKHEATNRTDAPSRDDVLEIIFTSGTTAEPKGVVITHANVLANLEPLEREIGKYSKYGKLVHPLRFLNLLPLSHVFGQFLAIFVPQALAATVIFHDSLNPSEIITTIKRQKVNVCVAVPHMLTSLKNQIEREVQKHADLDEFRSQRQRFEKKNFVRRWWTFRKIHSQFGWRFWAFISGGSALDEEDERFWSQLAFAVIQGYGLTETTSLVSVNHPFKASKRSIGKMLPGREVRLGPDGEIFVRGENVATRYWQANETKSLSTEDGWFPTGDLGALDSEGNLYFKGRKKNVIVTPAGMNVHPEDLEQVLRKQSGVRDVVVVGLPVGGNAETCAVLLMDSGASSNTAVESANRSLAEFQRISHHIDWPENDFPRTPTGKPVIAAIEQYVLSHGNQTPRAGVDGVLAKLRSSSGAGPSSELNLSSLEKVELMAALESHYQVDLSEVEFSAANTVQDLEKVIRGKETNAVEHVYPRWPRRWPFPWIRFAAYWMLAYPATLLFSKPKVVGRKLLRNVNGPLLVVCNHVTMVDIAFVLAALPPHVRTKISPAMQGEMLAAMRAPAASLSWWRRLVERFQYLAITGLFNVFPLPQKSSLLKSFSFAGEYIDHGYSVLVFPEGRRTSDGHLATFQTGIGMLATKLQVPVLPMRIDGLFEAAKDSRLFVRPNRIVVRVGNPVEYTLSENPTSIAKDLERRVREL
jgi:long-chain acyl-CoA synthetase